VSVPDRLYAPDDLLGGWSPSDPLSYARTYDATVYCAARREGLRTPATDEAAQARALHDHHITRALARAVTGREVVAFMGGHRLGRTSPGYRMVAEIAWRLTQAGRLVVSGGGPGAMEAAHLGARLAPWAHAELEAALALLAAEPEFPALEARELVDAGGDLTHDALVRLHRWQSPAFRVAARWPASEGGESIGIPTWLYGHEPPTPLASAIAKYYENSIREDGLLAIAKAGVIFAEGSAGTLQEVFQDAAQNHYRSVDDTCSPMVFLDIDEFWTVRRPVRLLLEGLFDDETERLLSFVTSVDAAVAAILEPVHVHPAHPPHRPAGA
jgi:predicted Rossmann-fold nucleotide-binding protein